MFSIVVGLLAIFTNAADGCASGGQIIRNPNFRFQFSPPVGWTYYKDALKSAVPTGTAYPGQQTSLNAAQTAVQNALDLSVSQALKTLRLPTTGFNISYGGYTPPDILIQEGPTDTVVGSYIVGGAGAVMKMRTQANSDIGTPFVKTMTVMVRGTPPASTSQWQFLANLVFEQLAVNEHVFFRSLITVF